MQIYGPGDAKTKAVKEMFEREETIEEMAHVIYERGFRYLRLDVPEWVPMGNSLAQDEARATAAQVFSIAVKESSE